MLKGSWLSDEYCQSALPLMSSFLTLFVEIWPMRFCVCFLDMSEVLSCVTCPCNIDLLLRKQQKYFYVLCIPCVWKLFDILLWFEVTLCLCLQALRLNPSTGSIRNPDVSIWKKRSWFDLLRASQAGKDE